MMNGISSIALAVCVWMFHGVEVFAAGCNHNGVDYPPDSDISLVYDEKTMACSGIYCTPGGEMVFWRGTDCVGKDTKRELAPLLSLVRKAETETKNCVRNGQTYPPNTKITSYYNAISSYCYGSYCSGNGQVHLWADLNCSPPEMRSSSLPNRKSGASSSVAMSDNDVGDDVSPLARGVFPKRAQLLRTLLDYYRRKLEKAN